MATTHKKPRAIALRKYHGYGMEASLQMLKENLWTAKRVELFPLDRIAFLDIPFGELFHRCTDDEWTDWSKFLSDNGVPVKTNRWWEFWER